MHLNDAGNSGGEGEATQPAGAIARFVPLAAPRVLLASHSYAKSGVSWLALRVPGAARATPSNLSRCIAAGARKSRCSKLHESWQQSVCRARPPAGTLVEVH